MDMQSFKNRFAQQTPRQDMPPELKALWHDANGDWGTAHRIVQGCSGTSAAWVHAYLHRKEGDLSNADYWYSHAGRSRPAVSLEQEWEDIAQALLAGSADR